MTHDLPLFSFFFPFFSHRPALRLSPPSLRIVDGESQVGEVSSSLSFFVRQVCVLRRRSGPSPPRPSRFFRCNKRSPPRALL
mmetsp:Transcript_21030/g.64945  ORF Transcript_21030/g.64945 Transcript_21030/m.64945 type:complete len:82 (-) Transcript_21030:129-374(-)